MILESAHKQIRKGDFQINPEMTRGKKNAYGLIRYKGPRMLIDRIQKQAKQLILGSMVAIAAILGEATPKTTEKSSLTRGQKIPIYQIGNAPSARSEKMASKSKSTAKSSKPAPVAQNTTRGSKTTATRGKQSSTLRSTTTQSGRGTSQKLQQKGPKAVSFSIPDMPELKFSNKLAIFPMLPPNGLTDKKIMENNIFRSAAPYIPDIFYEKSQLSYEERQKFLKSPEKETIMQALKKQLESKEVFKKPLVTKFVKGEYAGESLMKYILELCDEILIYGQPIVSLPNKTPSLREAVDLCGLTQLGKWMDIQKTKNREFKNIVPDGYDEAEAIHQNTYIYGLQRVYDTNLDYHRAIGLIPENPINEYFLYATKEDFSHLQPEKRKHLLTMLMYMPPKIENAFAVSQKDLYEAYQEIKADKTGYNYVLKHGYSPELDKKIAASVQELCLEMILYKRPLALLRVENFSLEQVIYMCRFQMAETFYNREKKGIIQTPKIDSISLAIEKLEAEALINLGEKFNHPDWVEFGNKMCPKEDFTGLSPEQKKELQDLMQLLPDSILYASRLDSLKLYKIYIAMNADKTGYRYAQDRFAGVLSQERAKKAQKLAMEMVIYRRPLALLHAENYTLEQVIHMCQFQMAETFYNREKKGIIQTPEIDQISLAIGKLEAEALINLGKKFNHPDWVEFGNGMLENATTMQTINREATKSRTAIDISSMYPKEDFIGLSPEQKKELQDLMQLLPDSILHASNMDSSKIYKIYTKMQADETGYRYAQDHFAGASSQEKATKLQKLAMEMVIYRRPLALLHAENYTLEQVIQVCKFNFAESFYRWQQKGNKKLGKTNEMGSTMISLQANALKTLGKKFNHPDWVQFGQEMYVAGQKCEVVRSHDDTPVIQHQMAPKSDQSSVRNQ